MNKIKTLLMYSAMAVFALTSCGDDGGDDPVNGSDSDNTVVSGEINASTTWTKNNVYQLSGRVVVTDGVTLTIEPGTIIKAEGGREANASVLIVARGGKISANGTASEPIIFTSLLDEIEPGMIQSPNLDASFSGLWGGVVILGRAPISADAQAVQIEGIPPSDQNGLYGGTNANDNSGSFTYVSIRHGGTLIGEGNEINGLTLGGVGDATVVNHVEVVANLDDGIECFGGSVNISDALVWYQGDDAYDIDQAYTGTIDNFVFLGNADSDHALEIDGPEGSLMGGCTLINGTLIGYNDNGVDGGEYADFRDGAQGTFSNLYFTQFSESSDVELDDALTSANYVAGDLTFTNWEINVSHLSGGNTDLGDIFADNGGATSAFTDLSFATKVTAPSSAGADASVFAGWTLGSAVGAL